jgi:hypothetical protein
VFETISIGVLSVAFHLEEGEVHLSSGSNLLLHLRSSETLGQFSICRPELTAPIWLYQRDAAVGETQDKINVVVKH